MVGSHLGGGARVRLGRVHGGPVVVTVLGVAVLGALGALVRWGVSVRSGAVPLATFGVNVAASLLLGLLVGRVGWWVEPLAVGFCGALSTWSTVGREVVLQRAPIGYLAATIAGCLGAAWVGIQLSG